MLMFDVDLILDVLLRHRHAELLGLLRKLFLLHEERDGRILEGRARRRADLRAGLSLSLVARAGHVHQLGERCLRDRSAVDLCDRVGGHGARVAASTAGGEQGDEQDSQEQERQACLHFHPVRSMSREAPLRR